MWTGLAPVYMKGCIQAILGGPNRKPVYKVTRKHDDVRWHWRQTLPQTTAVLAVLVVALYGIRFGTLPNLTLLAGTVYWGGLNVVLLGGSSPVDGAASTGCALGAVGARHGAWRRAAVSAGRLIPLDQAPLDPFSRARRRRGRRYGR